MIKMFLIYYFIGANEEERFMKRTKRCFTLILAGMLAIPRVSVYAEELTDGVVQEALAEKTLFDVYEESDIIEEINTNGEPETIEESDVTEDTAEDIEELIDEDPEGEALEELTGDLDEVNASSSTPTITGFYNSAKGGDIRWTKVSGASGYVLYRNRKADGLKKVATINNADSLQFIDGGIKDNCWGRVYSYYIRPIINGKEGSKSNAVTLQRLAPMKITKSVSNAPGQVSLTWNCTVKDNKALGYEIQYATSPADLYGQKGTFKKVSVDGRNNLNKTITGLATDGRYYCFRVRGYVNYTHSVTGKTTKTWSQYSDVVSLPVQREEANTNIRVGDTMYFGTYEQDNNTSNGKEKIEWIVLDKNGSSVLLISKYGLDYLPYNMTYSENKWENCTLRTWLNNTFLNTAFTTAEKGKISTTNVINEDNPEYGTEGGNNTNDKVFLLSISEACNYFKNDNDENGRLYGYSVERGCKPTQYVIAQGASQYQWKSEYTEKLKKFDGNSLWWLRSPGYNTFVAYVDELGEVALSGTYILAASVVRPALWINL